MQNRSLLTKRNLIFLAIIAVALGAWFGIPQLLRSPQEVTKVPDTPTARIGTTAVTHPSGVGDGSYSFVDVARATDLKNYFWSRGAPAQITILSDMGYGCAFLDYNNDGNLDILLIGKRLALYRGDGHGHFTDVTSATGLDKFHGLYEGCAVGDYDNDGFDDVYVTGFRTGLLLHNEGGKTFKDVTASSGTKKQPWGTSAAWGDYDNDGKLDLYICNYLTYDPVGKIQSCKPAPYSGFHGTLYHNMGGGRFKDVTKQLGADDVTGKGLGVAFVKYDSSKYPSIAIADDGVPSDLLHFDGEKFTNIGSAAGVAAQDSSLFAGMGIDSGDYNNDGHLDIVGTALPTQYKPVFTNMGGVFEEDAARLRLQEPLLNYSTFGVKWVDIDNDGWLDMMYSNGNVDCLGKDTTREDITLFHNESGQDFRDISDQSGSALGVPIVGRGLAIGDYDNDGNMDVLIVDAWGSPLLLHNEGRKSGHWLTIKLIGTKCNRDGIGAMVTAVAGGNTQTQYCHADGSYMSSSDLRVHFGLAGNTTVSLLTITWPDGIVQTLHNIAVDQIIRITEASGVRDSSKPR